ncbi:MAG: epoxyqueuosine reductase [Clostridiales bacterium]|nr:epoxyqueuosine reductase [Clostridiales bacterium]
MCTMSIENFTKETAYSFGANVCGIGSIDRFENTPAGYSPLDLFAKCKSVIAVGIALPKGLYEIAPRLLYGHFNHEICTVLDHLELKLSREIEEKYHCLAVPVPCDAPNEYWDAENMTAKGLISMKHTAVQCGLGSIGKNSLLINPEYGNRLTVGAILTDMELKPDPVQPELCISGCRKCIESCPVNAILDGIVNQKLCRLNTYGKTARGFDTVDCNICRTVCPMRFGKKG